MKILVILCTSNSPIFIPKFIPFFTNRFLIFFTFYCKGKSLNLTISLYQGFTFILKSTSFLRITFSFFQSSNLFFCVSNKSLRQEGNLVLQTSFVPNSVSTFFISSDVLVICYKKNIIKMKTNIISIMSFTYKFQIKSSLSYDQLFFVIFNQDFNSTEI